MPTARRSSRIEIGTISTVARGRAATRRGRRTSPRGSPSRFSRVPPWAILALVALVAVLILVGVAAATFSDRNWHPAITVNGVAIDRAHLRARVSLLRGLDDAMDAYLRDGRATGALTAEDEDALREALLPPRTLEDAMAGLVDDELTTTLARELNVSAERRATDAVATMLSRAVGPKLSWIEIRDSNALSRDSTARIAAATRALDSLSSGAALGVVSQTLKSSGWEVSSASGWLGALDQRLVPRAVLATIRKGPLEPRERLGPITTR